MIPSLIDGRSHIVRQDDELRRLAVVMWREGSRVWVQLPLGAINTEKPGGPTALGLKGLAPALDRPNLSEVYLPANRDECWFVSYDEKEKAVRAFLDKHFTALVILASAFLLAWAIIEYSRANRFEFIRMDSERGVLIDRRKGYVYVWTSSRGCVDVDQVDQARERAP